MRPSGALRGRPWSSSASRAPSRSRVGPSPSPLPIRLLDLDLLLADRLGDMLLIADDLLADPHALLGHDPLVDHRLLLAQLDGPLVRRHLGIPVAFAGSDRLALDAQLLPLDRDGPVLLLGDDPLADAGLAAWHLLGVDLQLLLGAGQGLLAGGRPPTG